MQPTELPCMEVWPPTPSGPQPAAAELGPLPAAVIHLLPQPALQGRGWRKGAQRAAVGTGPWSRNCAVRKKLGGTSRQGAEQEPMVGMWWETGRGIRESPKALAQAPLSSLDFFLQNIRPKIKLRISRWWPQNTQPKYRVFLNQARTIVKTKAPITPLT